MSIHSLIRPVPLGVQTIPGDRLAADRQNCRKIGPCGIGREALYIGSRFFARFYYIPWNEIRRVFKRVAMSPGGFSGRGVFGSMAYLVVQFGKDEQRSCYFRLENDVDVLLEQIRQEHPRIPLHSVESEKKLAQARAQERKKIPAPLTTEAESALASLRRAKEFLEEKPLLSRNLTAAAKQKRVADNLPAHVLMAGTAAGVLGLLAALYGLFSLISGGRYALYFLLGGAIVFFFVYSGNLFPSKWNSKKYAQAEWDKAVAECKDHIGSWEAFPVPPQYAHPLVLERMARTLEEGRAETAEKALELVKSDLAALNSDVRVSQQEHDEVVEIKPLFLVSRYQ